MDIPAERSNSWWRLVCWVGSVLAMLVSFWHDWSIPWFEIDLRPKRGHLVMEGYEVIKWALIGSLLGGWWWNSAVVAKQSGALVIGVWSCLGFSGWISREVFWLGWMVWLLQGLAGAVVTLPIRWTELKAFWTTSRPWNTWFWVYWFVVWVVCDSVLLGDAPPGVLETMDALLARMLTHAVIASGVALIMVWHDRWTPAIGKVLAWAMVIAVPLIVVLNTALRVWWGKGMIEMFGELEVGGRFEVERAWAAGGVEVDLKTVAVAIGLLILTYGLFRACHWLSNRSGCRVSPRKLAVVMILSWLVLQADQLAGSLTKDRGWLWWERKTFQRRMTWVEPKPGLAVYDVDWSNPVPIPVLAQPKQRPDVFLFFVESLRTDALRSEVAPFLTQFRDSECQPLEVTWAASNVTHQSWFSILSGRLPIFMEEARRKKDLAPLPSMLKSLGYRIEVRLVNDFSYMDMVSGNFGDPLQVDVMEHVDRESPENFFKVPQREVRMMDRLKQSVTSRSEGGLFAITGMDSTHYNYKWGVSFKPPFDDYEKNPIFPMRPSTEDVKRIQNRYWNSVAWVDSQIGGFVDWLKAQGRYDNAMIIVTGDHGEEFKEFGSWFHGTMLNEPQTRVPMLIKWPKKLGVGRGPEVDVASHLDLMPSMLDAFGEANVLWSRLPGISLLHPPTTSRTIVMSTHFCGRNGEALVLRRDGDEAAFSWKDFWTAKVPSEIWLERESGGPWQSSFSDVLNRVFSEVRTE